ncbi:hypothetical protein Glove_61g3 [Diversispora epigaea]|uniref:Uncharacterized protein n=1 Tax=Diversispora epigaea TaxID=1348612 RepID=A0A397JLA1_9GLOM|nr:hypothetical protein Glove_61g3 [Diversispora epigaea]
MDFSKGSEKELDNVSTLRLRRETYQKLKITRENLLKLEWRYSSLTDFNNLLKMESDNALEFRSQWETYLKLELHYSSLIDFNNLLEKETNEDHEEKIFSIGTKGLLII